MAKNERPFLWHLIRGFPLKTSTQLPKCQSTRNTRPLNQPSPQTKPWARLKALGTSPAAGPLWRCTWPSSTAPRAASICCGAGGNGPATRAARRGFLDEKLSTGAVGFSFIYFFRCIPWFGSRTSLLSPEELFLEAAAVPGSPGAKKLLRFFPCSFTPRTNRNQ